KEANRPGIAWEAKNNSALRPSRSLWYSEVVDSANPATPARPRLLDMLVLMALLAVIALRARPEFQLDEDRFVDYADNLARGFYADPVSKFIWNGPGYPLLLVPF